MILTLRTDKPEAEIGLFDMGGKELAYETWHAHRQLAETLYLKIMNLLESNDASWQDLKGIVCYKGPGSFTGLRIGLSAANGLAYGLGLAVTATGGDGWVLDGCQKLADGLGTKIAVPEYGSPVHITAPKR